MILASAILTADAGGSAVFTATANLPLGWDVSQVTCISNPVRLTGVAQVSIGGSVYGFLPAAGQGVIGGFPLLGGNQLRLDFAGFLAGDSITVTVWGDRATGKGAPGGGVGPGGLVQPVVNVNVAAPVVNVSVANPQRRAQAHLSMQVNQAAPKLIIPHPPAGSNQLIALYACTLSPRSGGNTAAIRLRSGSTSGDLLYLSYSPVLLPAILNHDFGGLLVTDSASGWWALADAAGDDWIVQIDYGYEVIGGGLSDPGGGITTPPTIVPNMA